MDRPSLRRRAVAVALAVLLAPFASHVPDPPPARAASATVPAGFRDELLFGGLSEPTAVQFASDGRVFVAEKRGRVLVFDSLADPSPSVFANLETNVHNFWDRGLLGLALDPDFPADPYVYVLYTYNHVLGDPSPAPRWPSDAISPWNDRCPSPPGANTDGCVVSGRLSRLTASGNAWTGAEKVLVEDWCQQFASHSVGGLGFGPEGALYAAAGDGARFTSVDYGQYGGTLPNTTDPVTPKNPCGDPPGGVGGAMPATTAEGGSFRAQDLRTRVAGDPVGLDGTVIRVDPATGAAWPTNANIADASPNARRIVGYGFRNPYRLTVRPGTDDVWIGNVGNQTVEELDVIANPAAAPRNFGWPCFEGSSPEAWFEPLANALCTSLDLADTTAPTLSYSHTTPVRPAGDGCGVGSSAISGLVFLPDDTGYPDAYDGALVIADYSRRCLWAIPLDASGQPDRNLAIRLADLRRPDGEVDGGAVHVTTTLGGDVAYVDYDRGEVRRIHHYGPNVPPTAAFSATPSSGPAPLAVAFDASGSSDPNGDPLTYTWDLDGDGAFDDGTGVKVNRTYTAVGPVTVRLRVTDFDGLTDDAQRTVSVGNSAPTVSISQPASSLLWKVGDTIGFSGSGTDLQDGTLPASAFRWTLTMRHCPSDCHSHLITEFAGVRSGTFAAPDHDYPSHLELRVTVTDSGGLTATAVRTIQPATGTTTARSDPLGVPVTVGALTGTSPTATSIVNSPIGVAAPATATLAGTSYVFDRWSDGGAAAHDVVTATGSRTLTAHYRATGPLTVYRPVAPVRLLDTRVGNGLSGPFQADVARTFQVTGRGGVPAGALAVTGNLTVVGATGAGFVSLTRTLPDGPRASTINFPAGDVRANHVTATLGPTGTLSAVLRAGAGKTTQLVFDVTGYFVAGGTGATYRTIGPSRLLDTRTGNGLSGAFRANTSRTWQIGGRGGVPVGAVAITANVTVVAQTAAGYVSVTPAATANPTTSTVNFPVGDIRANGIAVRLAANGSLAAVYRGPAGATTHLVVDVTGYFLDDGLGARYVPLLAARRLDTRIDLGLADPFAAGTPRTLAVERWLGVPAEAIAVAGNLTAVKPSRAGYVSAGPSTTGLTSTSTLNLPAGDIRSNGVVVRLSGTGTVALVYAAPSGARSDLLLDVWGFYRP